jgi:hypothetical protein
VKHCIRFKANRCDVKDHSVIATRWGRAAPPGELFRPVRKLRPSFAIEQSVYSYEELLRTIARSAGLQPVLMRMPFAFWNAVAGLAEMLPQPPLTRNQVELMQIDTTASENRPGFRALGISPRSLEEELEAMLKHSKTQNVCRPSHVINARAETQMRTWVGPMSWD